MRRKIAKRLKREIVKMGAVIQEDGWAVPRKSVPRKENGYIFKVMYRGYSIFAAGDDELESFRMVLDVMKYDCEEIFVRENETDGGNQDDQS